MAKAHDEIVFTEQSEGPFDKAKFKYQNPRHFNGRTIKGIRKVTVIGNWPAVVAAYEKAGAEVVTKAAGALAVEPPKAEPFRGNPDVEIPANWRDLEWQDIRSLAAKVSPTPVINRADAVAAIEAEIARRNG